MLGVLRNPTRDAAAELDVLLPASLERTFKRVQKPQRKKVERL